MALHAVPHEDVYIHLLKGDQSSASYTALNPSGTVPTLIVHGGAADGGDATLAQCIAIMEYLDEVYGPASATGRLLPSDPIARAGVRAIVDLVVGDLFPMLTMGILNRVKSHGVDSAKWAAECCASILPALEGLLKRTSTSGRYAYGDAVTMADAALVPQIYTVLRFYPDISGFPTVKSVFDHCSALPAFVAADWRHQPDTPDEFKAK
ncbi:hypothetical protein VHUM_01637 [Vanrija humicola]|uniref:Maleylacetoacetate isomerase n=1 Tax=Vanrija humicola TaxID=5417 RepID=A0A7D8V243_VANHU|nr:hypothetical protein VHUM_01637 [Vanrija humicola]